MHQVKISKWQGILHVQGEMWYTGGSRGQTQFFMYMFHAFDQFVHFVNCAAQFEDCQSVCAISSRVGHCAISKWVAY